MGSPYPIVLTTLTGYSDDLLQWYFDQESYENGDNKNQDIADCESFDNVQYKRTDVYSPSGLKTVDGCRSDYLEMNDVDITHTKEVNCIQEKSLQDEEESNFHDKHVDNGSTEIDISLIHHSHDNMSGTTGMDNELLVNYITEIDGDREQLTRSDLPEVGPGVFTMFELNPAAQKLLPNLVVGVKYRRQHSRTPELFIHEDNSFVTLS